MFSQAFRERVAVGFITLALGVAVLLTVVVIHDYNQERNPGAVAATNLGGVPVAVQTGLAASPGAALGASGPAALASILPGGTGNSGGGGGGGGAGGVSNNQGNSGVSHDRILVGGIYDISGGSPVDSSVERDTVKAYFAKVNAAGGINGRQLQMIDCDSQYDPNATATCVKHMIDNNVLAVVGWTAPRSENEAATQLEQAGIPIIGGLGTPNEFNSPISFPVSVSFTRYGAAEGLHAPKDLGFKHPAIIVLNDVPWIQPVLKALLVSLQQNGATPTHVEEVSATQDEAHYSQSVDNLLHQSDYGGPDQPTGGPADSHCSQISGYGTDDNGAPVCPDGLIAALDPFSYARLFQAMASANWHPGNKGHLLGVGLDKYNVQSAYGDEAFGDNSLVPFLSPYDHPDNPTVQDYQNTVKTYYPRQYDYLDIYTQHAWTAAMVFAAGLKAAGDNVTRASLVTALDGITNFDTGWSKPLSYGQGNHDPNHCFTYTHDDAPNGTWHTTSDWVCFP
ncbi:MAG: ABC transporter substrate-binding protein [Candidatus Dormibacteria bacterium]